MEDVSKPLRADELQFAKDCATLGNSFVEDLPSEELAGLVERYWARVDAIRGQEQIDQIAEKLAGDIGASPHLTEGQKRYRLGRITKLAEAQYLRQQESFRENFPIERELDAIGRFMRDTVVPVLQAHSNAGADPIGFITELPDGRGVAARVFPRAAGAMVIISDRDNPAMPKMPFEFFDEREEDNRAGPGVPLTSLHSRQPALAIGHLFAQADFWPFRLCRWEKCKARIFVPDSSSDNQSCSARCRNAFFNWARTTVGRPEYDPEYIQRRREAAARQSERRRLANVAAGKSRKRRKKTTKKTTTKKAGGK